MSQHFARISNNVVTSVIVINESVLDERGGWYCPETGVFAPRNEWVECSPDKTFRKNYPGKGYELDPTDDSFYPPKPVRNSSWVKDRINGNWKPPKEKPTLPVQAPFEWSWSEPALDWVKTEIPSDDPYERNECLKSGSCIIDPLTGQIIPNPDLA